MNKFEEVKNKINSKKARSAWKTGVKKYAIELIENIENDVNFEDFKNGNIQKILLQGADSWRAFSFGGSSLIYDFDIAKRLCNKTELKKTRDGEKEPNNRETWLDTQARALYQAYRLIKELI